MAQGEDAAKHKLVFHVLTRQLGSVLGFSYLIVTHKSNDIQYNVICGLFL